ncbi:MAG: segregation/condensation protein A [Ferruginibacter sp.]|nr:segregation/condensation protein A [Cytophagales bacterium]
MAFEIKLPLFEGPFDLLLFFIERDELNIHDIPIHRVTRDFLDYLQRLESLNLEVASEFILVAATLMRIKAKLLLPRLEKDEQGHEVDPRGELVRHLLEYRRYKSVVPALTILEEDRAGREARGNLVSELQSIAAVHSLEAELQDLDLYKLLRAFGRVMRRFEEEASPPRHTVVQHPYTVEGQKSRLLQRLATTRRLSFEEVINDERSKIAVVYTFLAILELLQLGQLILYPGEGFNNFWFERVERK